MVPGNLWHKYIKQVLSFNRALTNSKAVAVETFSGFTILGLIFLASTCRFFLLIHLFWTKCEFLTLLFDSQKRKQINATICIFWLLIHQNTQNFRFPHRNQHSSFACTEYAASVNSYLLSLCGNSSFRHSNRWIYNYFSSIL